MKKFIKDLKAGEAVESVFLLKRKELQRTKDNKPYLKVTLADKTGAIEGRVWEEADTFDKKIDTGDVLVVTGSVDNWRDNIQVKVERLRKAAPEQYKMQDLVRAIENAEEIFADIERRLGAVTNQWFKILIKKYFDEPDFIERFKTSPGAQSWHNAYIGGLLEHTHEVIVITEKACDLYPEADRETCLVGAFLHDSGKVFEIEPRTFELTLGGGLIGHLPLGFELLASRIASISGFPGDLALHLKHIILSHHGEYEQQSPVLPKTLEATIVYHADELVSQTNAVKELIRAQSGFQKVWSNYVSIKNRRYLLTKPE